MSLYEPRTELDLLAVRRDAEHLDAIARRAGHVPQPGVERLLAALTVEIDEGLARLLAEPLLPVAAPATPAAGGPGTGAAEVVSLNRALRRRTARAVTAAVLATGLVSVSGVAAAVTGDPLSPYRSVISAITGEDEKAAQRQLPKDGTDAEPGLARQVRVIEVAIESGNLTRAQSAVDALRAALARHAGRPSGAERAAAAKLTALEAKLARARLADDRTGHGRGGALAADPRGSGGTTLEPGDAAPRGGKVGTGGKSAKPGKAVKGSKGSKAGKAGKGSKGGKGTKAVRPGTWAGAGSNGRTGGGAASAPDVAPTTGPAPTTKGGRTQPHKVEATSADDATSGAGKANKG